MVIEWVIRRMEEREEEVNAQKWWLKRKQKWPVKRLDFGHQKVTKSVARWAIEINGETTARSLRCLIMPRVTILDANEPSCQEVQG